MRGTTEEHHIIPLRVQLCIYESISKRTWSKIIRKKKSSDKHRNNNINKHYNSNHHNTINNNTNHINNKTDNNYNRFDTITQTDTKMKKIKSIFISYDDGSLKCYNRAAFIKVLKMHVDEIRAMRQLDLEEREE